MELAAAPASIPLQIGEICDGKADKALPRLNPAAGIAGKVARTGRHATGLALETSAVEPMAPPAPAWG